MKELTAKEALDLHESDPTKFGSLLIRGEIYVDAEKRRRIRFNPWPYIETTYVISDGDRELVIY